MADQPAPTDLADLVNLAAVQVQLGETLAAPETDQVTWFAVRARSTMLSQVPLLQERLTSGALDPNLAKGVGCDIVISALDAMRTGLRIKSEQYPESTTEYFKATADELIAISASQIALLAPRLPGAAGAYVVSLSG